MARPLFEIAKEISADWQSPSPQAESYLKGMYCLLGMDDFVADLDASTAVRMFLLYSKTWVGPVAERVKAELQGMRTANAPTNADLLGGHAFVPVEMTITHCELCDALLTAPAKFVDGYTHWGKRLRMCLHCNYCISSGPYEGNGALYIADAGGVWHKLHGEPVAPPEPIVPISAPRGSVAPKKLAPEPTLQFQLKLLGRKVVKKCAAIVRGLTRRSA